MKANQLIILDVCNTLVDANSTFSYVDYLLNKGVKSGYKILFHNRFLGYFYAILYLLFKFDSKIFLVKKYFKGLKVSEIKKLSGEYFKRYENKIFPDLLKIINKEKSTSKIILLSSSINPPIDFLKQKFGIEGFSSKLEEKNGKYTGKILQPLWGKKEIIFKNKLFNLNKYHQINFYTDNRDDTNLIKYLYRQNNYLKIYIRLYGNKKYWDKFFTINKINYEFMD